MAIIDVDPTWQPPPPADGGGGAFPTLAEQIQELATALGVDYQTAAGIFFNYNVPSAGGGGGGFGGGTDHFFDVNPLDQAMFNHTQNMDMIGAGLDRDIFGFNQNQFNKTFGLDQAMFNHQKALDTVASALAVGDFDLARQAQSSADYWQGISAQQSAQGLNLQNQGQQLDYSLGMANVGLGADRNAISLADVQERGNLGLLDDYSRRALGTQANQTGQFTAETTRAANQAATGMDVNRFLLDKATSPRDLFGLYFLQRGVTPDWDTMAAGGTPATGDALSPVNPMKFYQGLPTGAPDFSTTASNPYAGMIGSAASGVNLSGGNVANAAPPNFLPYANTNTAYGPPKVGPTPLNQLPSYLPEEQPTPQYKDINPGGQYGGVPLAGIQPGWNLSTIGGEGTVRGNFDPRLGVYSARDFGTGINDPSAKLGAGQQYWVFAPPDWTTTQTPTGGTKLNVTNPVSYPPPKKYALGGNTWDKRFIVGDSPSGQRTGYEEMVYNPTGAPMGIRPMHRTDARQASPHNLTQFGVAPNYVSPSVLVGGKTGATASQNPPSAFRYGLNPMVSPVQGATPYGTGNPYARNPLAGVPSMEAIRAHNARNQQAWPQGNSFGGATNPTGASFVQTASNGVPAPASFSQMASNGIPAAYTNTGNSDLFLQSSANQHLNGMDLPQRLQMLARQGMPISPGLAAATSGRGLGLFNTQNAVAARGGGVLPSLQTLRRMGPDERQSLMEAYYGGVVGINPQNIMDYLSGVTANLGTARRVV